MIIKNLFTKKKLQAVAASLLLAMFSLQPTMSMNAQEENNKINLKTKRKYTSTEVFSEQLFSTENVMNTKFKKAKELYKTAPEKAISLYEKLAKEEYVSAMARLIKIYLKGRTRFSNFTRGQELLQKLIILANKAAENNNVSKAIDLFAIGAYNGNQYAEKRLKELEKEELDDIISSSATNLPRKKENNWDTNK